MQNENAQLVEAPQQQISQGITQEALTFDSSKMDAMQHVAQLMASAKVTIPQHLRNNPGDCLAVIMQAAQWRMNPYAVAQKTYLVNGALGYEAQLVNAVVSSSSLLVGRVDYAFEGDWTGVDGKSDSDESRAVTVKATLRGEEKPRDLRISMAQVGDVRNSPLWKADPRQQLAYLATKRWARLHAPDVLLGVYTPDELEALEPVVQVETVGADELMTRIAPQEEQTKKPEPVTLDSVLEAIESAASIEELTEAGKAGGMLVNGLEKDRARKAYQAKKQELENAQQKDDKPKRRRGRPRKNPPSPQEAAQDQTADVETYSADSLTDRIVDSTNPDEILELQDFANSLSDPDEKGAVQAIADKRLKELGAG